MDSAREKMMHQKVQSFGTPLERLSGRLAEDDEDDEGSMAELAILVRWWEKRCRREKQGEREKEERPDGGSLK
jgi:hypothetical protein